MSYKGPFVDESVPRKLKSIVCPNCGHTIKYAECDVQRVSWREMDGGSSCEYVLTCPFAPCKRSITIPGRGY